ncbi:MAG: M23 family metallopeptidase, partial [Oscillospiraceae bacterium]|nr:M23 family metallopeptidase [Oscillospiraceae bacterium]
MQKLILKWLSKKVLWWAFSFIFSGFFFFIIIFSSAFIMISSATLIPEIPEISPELPPIYSGDFIYPIPTYRTVSSHFGYRTNPVTGKNELHGGTDFHAPHGTKVVSTADGIVEFSGWNSGGFGYLVVINHGENLKSLYAHNSRL